MNTEYCMQQGSKNGSPGKSDQYSSEDRSTADLVRQVQVTQLIEIWSGPKHRQSGH